MEEKELFWAAGFWDGEGYTGITQQAVNGNIRIVMSLAQVKREPLERFQKALGFGSIRGPYTQRNKNSKPYYVWGVEGKSHCENLMRLIGDKVCSVKREQMNEALAARIAWEQEAECVVGHPLTRYPSGKMQCRECLSSAGKKAVTARWGDTSKRTSKVCSLCKVDLPLTNFNSQKSSRDGVQSVCRECMKEYRRKRREGGADVQHSSNV